jgi:hypothetical protein
LACIGLALALPVVIRGRKGIRRRRAPKPPASDALRAVAPVPTQHEPAVAVVPIGKEPNTLAKLG